LIIFTIFLGHQNPGPDNNIDRNISKLLKYGYMSSFKVFVVQYYDKSHIEHLLLGEK
jgi:hypothetical protein